MHRLGVVHGDVKAANVLTTEDLSVVKATDLGLAGGEFDTLERSD